MKIEKGSLLERIQPPFLKHKMKMKDKELFIESVILIVIYLLSFGILSLGRVQQTFLGISETVFSGIQMITLTFVFAVIITLIVYYAYKQAIK